MAPEYHQITDRQIQEQVRTKYRASIDQLKVLNFEESGFFSETVQAFGLSEGLSGMLGALAALPNEISKVNRDLSASLFFLLLVSREYDTYASSMGLGTKFYTGFTDGTLVITVNFDSFVIQDDQEKLYRYSLPGTIEEAWKHHQSRVIELTATGKQRSYHLSFDHFTKLTQKEDRQARKAVSGRTSRFVWVNIGMVILACLLAAAFLFILPR